MGVSQPVRVAETDVFVGDERGNVIFQGVAVASWSTLKGGCHGYDTRRRRRKRKDKLCQENAEIDVQPNSSLFFSKLNKKMTERRQKKGVTNNEIETSGKKNKIRRNYLLRRAFFICLLCRTRNYRQINKLFKSTIYVILANHPYKIYCNTLLSSQQSLCPKTNPPE